SMVLRVLQFTSMQTVSSFERLRVSLLRPLLTSAIASPLVAKRIDLEGHDDRSPQVSSMIFIPRPPHLPRRLRDRYRTSPCSAGSSRRRSLGCGSCSSGRDFASGFLPTSPHDDAVAIGQRFPLPGSVEDLHLLINEHAGHTET